MGGSSVGGGEEDGGRWGGRDRRGEIEGEGGQRRRMWEGEEEYIFAD